MANANFFSSLSERESLLLRPTFYLPILVAWSVSILQFIFVQNHDELKRVQEGSNTYLKVLDTYEEIIMMRTARNGPSCVSTV